MKVVVHREAKPAVNSRLRKAKGYKLFLMSLPFVLLVLAFNYVPLFGWIWAFFYYRPGIPLADSAFRGIEYFRIMAEDYRELVRVLANTLIISFLGILLSPVYAAFAIFLNEMKSGKFKKIVQTTTTLPNFISWVLVYAVFFIFFASDGVINQLFMELGWISRPLNILGNNEIVWYVQALVVLWKGLGWGAIIYLAAIAGIDQELYDAAKVDGAGRFRTIRHITIPGLLPTYIVLLLLSVGNMLSNGFEQFFVFYNPLVAQNIEVLDYYTYRIGFVNNDFSYATAIGITKTFVSVVLLFLVNWIAKRVRGESIF